MAAAAPNATPPKQGGFRAWINKRLPVDDVWRKARLSIEQQRPGAAKGAVGLLGNNQARDAAESACESL